MSTASYCVLFQPQLSSDLQVSLLCECHLPDVEKRAAAAPVCSAIAVHRGYYFVGRHNFSANPDIRTLQGEDVAILTLSSPQQEGEQQQEQVQQQQQLLLSEWIQELLEHRVMGPMQHMELLAAMEGCRAAAWQVRTHTCVQPCPHLLYMFVGHRVACGTPQVPLFIKLRQSN
jgi:hypothetical protein